MKTVVFDGDFPVTQEYGENKEYYGRLFGAWGGHNGRDFGLPVGTPLRTPEDGTVTEAYDDGPQGYGLTIYVTGTSGKGYRYGHASELRVAQGQYVTAGQLVALSGNTGNSTGPHLHFGARPAAPDYSNGTNGYVDPQPILDEFWKAQEMADSERQALQAQIDNLNGIVAELGNQKAALETEVAGLNGIGVELQSQVDALRTEVAVRTQELAECKAQVVSTGASPDELKTAQVKLDRIAEILKA